MSINIVQGTALVCLGWSCTVFLLQLVGITKLYRNHTTPLPPPASPSLPENEVPHVTVIRPVKGVEVGLYECLASTFRLAYPKSKLSIRLCVDSKSDPAYPVLCQLVVDFPNFDAQVLVEEEDPILHGSAGHVNNLGPNPKIRNISRAYREAKGDVIWIVDCNVWVAKNAAGRMVDKLFGFQPNSGGGVDRTTPYKFVHQLPLVVDLDNSSSGASAVNKSSSTEGQSLLPSTVPKDNQNRNQGLLAHGGRLEEMFMSTTHAKFYGAINAVGVAPCIVGKSNMFRKSHLDAFTTVSSNPLLHSSDSTRGTGIDFFSSYICEDHLIGDLIWRSSFPGSVGYKNHGLVFGEVAVQPMAGMSVAAYIARRVRWLRVRKWTVLAATLMEPGVESLVCCAYFAFAVTTLPWFNSTFGVPQTWSAMATLWAGAVTIWMSIDRWLTSKLFRLHSLDVDENTPFFARGTARTGGTAQRPFREWIAAWLGREFLALPIWTTAVLLGTTVKWRGRQFKVRMDMSVVEVDDRKSRAGVIGGSKARPRMAGSPDSKDRVD
ncbi:ceramide glucosyltransferase [Neurospora intermedia]|uniref:Ceramide glucosyltransferase n=1 Tax=Neurospora intermedia TaxID=5142 RepID=A0ABR3D0M2_NEUIN